MADVKAIPFHTFEEKKSLHTVLYEGIREQSRAASYARTTTYIELRTSSCERSSAKEDDGVRRNAAPRFCGVAAPFSRRVEGWAQV